MQYLTYRAWKVFGDVGPWRAAKPYLLDSALPSLAQKIL